MTAKLLIGELEVLWCSLHVDSAPSLRRGAVVSPVVLIHACGPGWIRSIDLDVPGDAMSLCHDKKLEGAPGASNMAPEAER